MMPDVILCNQLHSVLVGLVKMSELNEDILNYEIGDVDDTDLTGADEDELLLSDDESFSGRSVPNHTEDDLLSSSQCENKQSTDLESETKCIGDSVSPSCDDKQKISGSKVHRNVDRPQLKSPCISSESDCVTRANEEDVEPAAQPTQIQNVYERKESDPSATSDDRSESTVYEASESYSQSDDTENKSESTFASTSQDVSEENKETIIEHTSDDYDADDSDDVRERRNPKLCSEREIPQQSEDISRQKHFPQNYSRSRHMRPQMPRPNHPYGAPGGPEFNPSFMPQFRGPRRQMPPNAQPDFMRNHPIGMMRGGIPNHMQRMPPGMQPHPQRMPVGPGQLGPPHQRMQRPMFQPSPGMFGNNTGMPQGMIRPRVPPNAHQMMPQRPPFGSYPQQNHPANIRHPMNPSMPPRAQPMNPAVQNPSLPLPIIGGPRKVLINPNFKGGVQAATNQLMLDTMKNSQLMENSREAELLRQQEAFINQNRMHIEKRRRSREHSPERERDYRERDRERERSYSPPRRRGERDNRKPHPGNFRENRTRRADSRERDHLEAKKKRNDSENNTDKNEPKTDEDEETRAYRLEIEKQKAQREKILRDKEMRRRKAAEEIKKEEEKKTVDDKEMRLKPIIVTEKKIISLKKKQNDGAGEQSQQPKTVQLTRRMQKASGSDSVASESGSQKNLLRSSSQNKLRADDEDLDEDELLADSPPPTSMPAGDAALKPRINASKVGDIPTTMFANRRIVVRNVDNVTNNENNLTNKTNTGTGKGIFDRLDKKVVSVNDAAKRKIQRIVINNSD